MILTDSGMNTFFKLVQFSKVKLDITYNWFDNVIFSNYIQKLNAYVPINNTEFGTVSVFNPDF